MIGDEGCSCTLSKLKSYTVLKFICPFIVEVDWLKSVCWTWWGFSFRVDDMFYFESAHFGLPHKGDS